MGAGRLRAKRIVSAHYNHVSGRSTEAGCVSRFSFNSTLFFRSTV
ncbi:hypothetical protein BURPS1106B_A0376 [Burkholderia pseudomallei 1106b]|uniref:Uncharacterized protein n=2 Tax=Burkholderia pseudomallei TaxID=28450 RepID=A0A0E1W0Y3_BURPE|nr:hypothetical protein BURPS668_1116 [Burkholderia pseudomallei 668]ABN90829.1 hypothetical protein BURPS1106A_1122 [Burkholderia pseudomallei 1106a]EEH29513.1 conserved hypothetical protein [Burkholderia pseudomallei Pakistan 9]EES25033.1 hypothetical protein BURPS1106B_A0376 [Burkholderia pseudomallei 1106b]EET06850.1 hypothetical protein BURPS1710A_1409 [Burkholderia pseudomallei 1710a]KGS37599.1 hypothetical protein X945_5266 [Burkholderia pseudomallei ABCPW 107]